MPAAQSPRTPAPRLRATHVEAGETSRKGMSVYQAVATTRGYTVKAGAATRARLHRGIQRNDGMVVIERDDDAITSSSEEVDNDAN